MEQSQQNNEEKNIRQGKTIGNKEVLVRKKTCIRANKTLQSSNETNMHNNKR